jgi:hypothetical protein
MKKNDSFWSILINLPFIIGYDSLLWGYMLFSALSYDKKA